MNTDRADSHGFLQIIQRTGAGLYRLARHTFPRLLTRPTIASALTALILTALLYGDALTLPLFSDDVVLIPWLESTSWRALWTAPTIYARYYRPLWFTLWRVWGGLVGGLHPLGLHLLNVVAHFVASWLVGLLVIAWMPPSAGEGGGLPSLSGRAPLALWATVLFAVFPFSRQAIAWSGALYNPLVAAMAAGALLAYDRGRRGYGGWWIGLALLLATLAPFNYEVGMLVGPLVVAVEGVGWLQRSLAKPGEIPLRWYRRSWWPLAFVSSSIIVVLIWRAVRGTGVVGFGLTYPDLRHNVGYLVQGLIYPLAPLAQWLAAWQELDPELCLWLIALPTLALLTWSGLRWYRDVFWLGLLWFVLFALPPVVTMEADWFALAPRYLYLPAAGVSMVWTAAIGGWLKPLCPSRRALVAGALLVALAPAAIFVRDGIRLYRMAGESIWSAAEAAIEERPLLLVNLPMRITPRGRVYPLGFEGVTPLPMRVTAEELVYVHTGIHGAAEAVAFGVAAVDEPPGYTYQLFGQPVGWEDLAAAARQARAVYMADYQPGRIALIEAGAVGAVALPRDPSGEPLAHFGDRVTLLDGMCTCDGTGRVRLVAHWRVEAGLETDVTVFAHLLGPDGALVTQADGYPLLGMFPFWLWEPGEAVQDVRYFDPVPPGEYIVRLGMWELATGKHWPAVGSPDGVVYLPAHCP